MKSLVVVCGALLLIISLSAFFTGTHDARVQDREESFAGVTTAAGVFSANVTLGQAVHDNNVISITNITSNVTGDIPAAANWTAATRFLRASGLAASQTRTLVVNYEIDSTLLPSGASVFLDLSNWFYIFAILGMIAGAIYAFFTS